MKKEKICLMIQKCGSENEEKTLSPFSCKSTEGLRLYKELSRNEEIRPEFSHDADRIIHSRAYSRYSDKTQVFSFFENDHIQHRALHVQLVSKIGRSIGRSLKLNEDLIEAIALGHDVGHTPFGHDGEKFINEICVQNEIGFFTHNAQSVRVLSEIEKKGVGLNLTIQVMDGILCHNGEEISGKYKPNKNKSREDFLKEYNDCFKIDKSGKHLVPMTLEGCLVRFVDVIAYIGRDFEDALRLNIITEDDIPEDIKEYFDINPENDINTKIIDKVAKDIVFNSYGKDFISISNENIKMINRLKIISKSKIYKNEIITHEINKTAGMFNQLFEYYLSNYENEECGICKWRSSMSAEYNKNEKKRIIIDYISCMTDDFFINEYNNLFLPQSLGYKIKKEEYISAPPPNENNT